MSERTGREIDRKIIDELRIATMRLARRLRQESEYEFTATVQAALATLGSRGPLTLGQLADIENVTPSTITRMVDRLEDLRLAKRVPYANDRRVWQIELTVEGRRVVRDMHDRRNAFLEERISTLPDESFEAVPHIVNVLKAILGEPIP